MQFVLSNSSIIFIIHRSIGARVLVSPIQHLVLETFRFDYEYEFVYDNDILETIRFDYEYEFDYEYDFLENFRFGYKYAGV